MTETEIQKLFAYQYGLLNNNLVLPNITMKGSEGGNDVPHQENVLSFLRNRINVK